MSHVLLKKTPTPIVTTIIILAGRELKKNNIYVFEFKCNDVPYLIIFKPQMDGHENGVGDFVHVTLKEYRRCINCCTVSETMDRQYKTATYQQKAHFEICERLNKYVEPPF